MSTQTAVRVKETIPLWLAVAITVLVSIPFGLWLGKWSFTLWVAFIVWAEYFQYGAKPSAIKLILPSYTYGAIVTGITLLLVQLFQFLPSVLVPGDLALGLILSAGVGFMVYSMRWAKVFQEGSLAFFNGITMCLGVYFSGSYPNIIAAPWNTVWAGIWASLMAIFGVCLGVFNIWITFPKEIKD